VVLASWMSEGALRAHYDTPALPPPLSASSWDPYWRDRATSSCTDWPATLHAEDPNLPDPVAVRLNARPAGIGKDEGRTRGLEATATLGEAGGIEKRPCLFSTPSAISCRCSTRLGSAQKPKHSRPASDTADTRRAWRSPISAIECSCCTGASSTLTGTGGPGTLDTLRAKRRGLLSMRVRNCSSRGEDVGDLVQEDLAVLRVARALALAGRDVHRAQSRHRVRLVHGQREGEERVLVGDGVALVVEADGTRERESSRGRRDAAAANARSRRRRSSGRRR